jgi:nucleoside 2-deoxyribosyltransferase
MRRLNLYLASSFSLKDTIDWLWKRLETDHNIPDHWWNIDSKNELQADIFWYGKPETKAIEKRHFQQIKNSDALILVGDIFGNTTPSFNGANVEVGYALALGIPVYSVGTISRSAMYSSVIRCSTTSDLEKCLDIQALSER